MLNISVVQSIQDVGGMNMTQRRTTSASITSKISCIFGKREKKCKEKRIEIKIQILDIVKETGVNKNNSVVFGDRIQYWKKSKE